MSSEPTHCAYMSDKDRYIARLKRIEGQTRGLQRMIEEEKYCIDILTQISAVNSALETVAVSLLRDHLRHCVTEAVKNDEGIEEKIAEATAAITRMLKS
ncbi:metal-sensitive transcriptional regulator [Corynebacterium aquatimens]|uniref:metal-sensitive transcriptional regulator n=1 Tax=Corynebacterium TaxID=1716 RepID=UPI001F394287|nr:MULTISPECIES: metal-sensitive transcriptional regulator [Corynebacterium]QYH20050.1 metal-sensitive transcriptional regulator [Corynebacterium aquatimens]UIZ92741.1 metal-sensitive transcriptional regulator [Corynebacterium sp. CNCTC7651]